MAIIDYDNAMLKIENLCLKINNNSTLENISFFAKRGQITVITGSNGSGKTTLLKTIAGIHKQTQGKIFLDDLEITNYSINQRANCGFSIAFQHPTLFKGLSVQNLLEIANPSAKELEKSCNFLSQVGLCARDYLNREFNHTLSGGERKRIELAITLARGALVNLFDEPESGIDMWSFDDLLEIFENLKKQNKIVVIVSHNPKIIAMADQLVVLEKGSISKVGSPDSVLEYIKKDACIKLKKQGGKSA